MISRSRKATQLATGGLILTFTVQPLAAQWQAQAQRGGPPRPDTPQLVVSVLASSDRKVGVEASDAIRKRIQDEHSAADLYVVPQSTVDAMLRSSGYNPDSSLGTNDLLELTRAARGDYALDGTVERTSSGVRTIIRLLTRRGQTVVAEPLAPVVGKDFGDVAKQVDRAVADALRALAFNRDCMNAFVMGDYVKAMAAARQGLKIRPTSAALNQCVLSTLLATHATPDSVIAVASLITSVDSGNVVAWASLSDAYTQKGDKGRALESVRAVHRVDPSSVSFAASLVDQLALGARLDEALAVLDTALKASPDNATLLRQRWLIQMRLNQFANALVSGKALVAADSSAATEDFFTRQLSAAVSVHDSASTRALELDALAHFPRNRTFLTLRARDALNEGNASEALGLIARELAIEPKDETTLRLAIVAQAKANGADSAIAAARRALAGGVSADAVGEVLVTVVTPVLATAQASQKREDWESVLRTAQAVDTVAPSPRSAFYLGVAAYSVASDEAQSLAPIMAKRTRTAAERVSACASATRVDELARTVAIALPRGGRVDPTNAGKILTALPSLSEFASRAKQATCRARDESN